MFTKIKPIGNRIVVQRQEARTTRGGIFLPEAAQEKPREGEVVAVGNGTIDAKGHQTSLSLKVGDRVLFSSYSGTEYKIGGVDYLILSEEDLLAKLS